MKRNYSSLLLAFALAILAAWPANNLHACSSYTSGSGNGLQTSSAGCNGWSATIGIPVTGYGRFYSMDNSGSGGVYQLQKYSGNSANYCEIRSGLNSGTLMAAGTVNFLYRQTTGTNAYVGYWVNSGCGSNWSGQTNSGGSGVFRVYRYYPNTASISASTSCSSTTLSASVGSTGGYYPDYQWQGSNDNSSWTNISGATGSSMATTSYTQYVYYRVRTGFGGCYRYSGSQIVVPRTTYSGNITVSQNITMGGTYNINGNFTVNSGVTISEPTGCELVVNATNIYMYGTINGNSAGYNGGGNSGTRGAYVPCGNESGNYQSGGGGYNGLAGSGAGGGFAGGDGGDGYGHDRICGNLFCSGNSAGHYGGGGGAGGGGGGSYGGYGGTGGYGAYGSWFNSGEDGYGSYGAGGSRGNLYNSTYDVSLGSGGGGGGGGGACRYSGSTGTSGGRGGGSVSLIASNTLTLTGTISVNGQTAPGIGGSGSANGQGDQNCTTQDCGYCSICGLVTNNGSYSASGGAGGGPGGGSGGGIRLQAWSNMSVTGTLNANGGNGGQAGYPTSNEGSCHDYAKGGGGGGGGRIKIILNPCATNNIAPTTNLNGGSGGVRSGTSTGNSGNTGVYEPAINHPSYSTPNGGTIAPSSQTICTGGDVPAFTNSASASGGTGSYTYNWFSCTGGGCSTPSNGSSSAGTGWTNRGTNSTVFNEGTITQSTSYIRRVQTGECYYWSNRIEVNVVADPTVSITTGAQTICSGGSLTLSLTSGNGTGSCTNQWQVSTTSSSSGFSNLGTGSTQATGALTTTSWYRVVRTCSGTGCDAAVSNVVQITVNPDPTISITTPSQTVCDGANITLTSSTSGGVSCGYQWQSSITSSTTGFSNMGTGSTQATGAIGQTTWYRVYRNCSGNGCSSPVSNVIQLTVVPDPTISIITTNQTICSGGNVTLTAFASGGTGTISYQWQVSNDGSTGWSNVGTSSLSYNTGAITATKFYRVQVSASGTGCANPYSNVVEITVVPDQTVTIYPGNTTICDGDAVDLIAFVSNGTGACYFNWQKSTTSTSGPWSSFGSGGIFENTGALSQETYYKITYTCTGTGCNDASDVITVSISYDNVWTGYAGSGGIGYWDVPANWSCNIVPNNTHDVVIPASAPNQPVVRDKATYSAAQCHTLQIENGANITIQNKGELRVHD